MGALIGVGEVAHRPVLRRLTGGKAEGEGMFVPGLELHFGKVHRPGVDAWRRPGFEPPQRQPHLQQRVGEGGGGVHAVGAGLLDAFADDGTAPEIRARGDDDGPGLIHGPCPQHHPAHPALLRLNGHHFALTHRQVLLPLQRGLHNPLVLPAVGLGPQRPHRRALAPVQHPVLDAGPVGSLGHLAAQRVQLPHQVALAGAADGGVAGHVAHGVQVDGEHNGFQAHPGRRQRRFNAGVARADDRNIHLSCQKPLHAATSFLYLTPLLYPFFP